MGGCNSAADRARLAPEGAPKSDDNASAHALVNQPKKARKPGLAGLFPSPIRRRKDEESGRRPDDITDLGQAFWEYRSAKIAALACSIYVIGVMTLFAHNVTLGSFWCPFSRCELNRQAHSTDDTLRSQLLGLSVICFVLDIWVIFFHVTHAVHPKYIVTRIRRFVIGTHLVSGALQCILGPTAWLMYRFADAPFATEALIKGLVVWCFAAHMTTAMFLARTPFGAVRVMLPAFIFVIGMYGYTLGELWGNTYTELEAPLLQWWIMTHIYVFNRITFAILTQLNMLANVRYTVSILLGSAVCGPMSMGVSISAFLYGAIVVFNLAWYAVREPGVHDVQEGKPKHFSAGGDYTEALVADHFVQPEGSVYAASLRELGAHKLSTQQIARIVYDKLDADRTGAIELADLMRLLVSWGLPSYVAREVFTERDKNGDGLISFDEFHDNFSDVWHFAATVVIGNVQGVHSHQRRGQLVKVDSKGSLVIGSL